MAKKKSLIKLTFEQMSVCPWQAFKTQFNVCKVYLNGVIFRPVLRQLPYPQTLV